MSKPRAKWWSYIRNILYDYPRLRSELDALQAPLQATGEHYGGHGIGRPAEAAALRALPDKQEQRELEAVEAAIRETEGLPDGKLRLRIIDMVFWARSHTLQGAAMAMHLSYEGAKRKRRQFMKLVAENLGLAEKSNHKSQKNVLK